MSLSDNESSKSDSPKNSKKDFEFVKSKMVIKQPTIQFE
jgi:hypothetical protein